MLRVTMLILTLTTPVDSTLVTSLHTCQHEHKLSVYDREISKEAGNITNLPDDMAGFLGSM